MNKTTITKKFDSNRNEHYYVVEMTNVFKIAYSDFATAMHMLAKHKYVNITFEGFDDAN